MSLSWPAPLPLTTNCQRKTRQAIMKTQIRICLTVEFKANFLIFRSCDSSLIGAVADPASVTPKRRECLQH